MSLDDELKRLAMQREQSFELALDKLDLEPPDRLLRQLRAYLADQEDYDRIKQFEEKSVYLVQESDGIQELASDTVQFASGSTLDFKVRMEKQQTGWRIVQFMFHLRLPTTRMIGMVRIHLNTRRTRDPLTVPRCHIHIGGERPEFR